MTTNNNALILGTALHTVATSTPTAQEVTLFHAARQRDARMGTTDIQSTEKRLLRMGKRIVHVEYTQYWNDLEKAGVGSIIRGRNGKADRFAWNYSLKEVAIAAMESKDLKATEVSTPSPKKVVHQAPKARSRSLVISGKRKVGRPPMVVSLSLSKGEVLTLQRILAKARK